ncbi:hypothetical protein TP51_003030 [Salmonella enterica subsp. enterica]|nr:hypothetical protein [Salmonella enterica subsp. enterica serovar Rubislaw]EEA7823041.1 hypothetical protein [Salmonella enterica subsp. enterica serovar Miami]
MTAGYMLGTFFIVLCMAAPAFYILWLRHQYYVSVIDEQEREKAESSRKWRDNFLNTGDFRK